MGLHKVHRMKGRDDFTQIGGTEEKFPGDRRP